MGARPDSNGPLVSGRIDQMDLRVRPDERLQWRPSGCVNPPVSALIRSALEWQFEPEAAGAP